MTWIIAACVMIVASVVQRVTGLGFARCCSHQRGFVATAQVIFIAYHLLTLAWRGLPASGTLLELPAQFP